MPRGRPKKTVPKLESDFNRASPEERTAMLAALTNTQNYKRKGTVGPRMQATEKQLASLAKARATRAAKKTGTTVAVAVASPKSESDFNRASPEQRKAMLAALTDTQNYKRKGTVGPRMQATEKQLASLAKARATRAAKKTGTTVSVVVAAPAVKRTRARLTQEQKALKEQEIANKKIAREQKKANMAQMKADKVLARELAKAAKPQKKKAKMD